MSGVALDFPHGSFRASSVAEAGERDGLVDALAEWAAVASVPKRLLIDGEWREARSASVLTVADPATGRGLCTVADADERDALDALEAASAAAAAWASRPPRERARVLRRAADSLIEGIDRFALIITLEMGKPLTESRDEVAFAAEYLERCADAAANVTGTHQESPDGRSRILVLRRPVGPCLLITPWNFPLAVAARGIAAALAVGCTAVLRPSSLTPLSALALAATLEQAGLPPGVLNIVVSSADGTTDPLLADSRLRRLTFTGSTPVGRLLLAKSAEQVLGLAWSSAARPRSSSSTTRTSTPPSMEPSPQRCGTAGRPAPPQTASTSTGTSRRSSRTCWPAGSPPFASVAAPGESTWAR